MNVSFLSSFKPLNQRFSHSPSHNEDLTPERAVISVRFDAFVLQLAKLNSLTLLCCLKTLKDLVVAPCNLHAFLTIHPLPSTPPCVHISQPEVLEYTSDNEGFLFCAKTLVVRLSVKAHLCFTHLHVS